MIHLISRSALAVAGGALACLLAGLGLGPAAASAALASTESGDAPLHRTTELMIAADGAVRVDGLFTTDTAETTRLHAAAAALDADAWKNILRVVVRDPLRSDDGADLPALLGRFRLTETGVRFEPRFPPGPGLLVEASFDREGWNRSVGDDLPAGVDERQLRLAPRDAEPETHVVAVYPAVDVVPANLLRFYVQFSAPMGARHVLPHIRLRHQDGTEVKTAFVEVQGGLWDPERTRLTLFVHPGRVKRGVGPNQALGPVLEEGKTYRLHVEADAHDARGLPLVAPHETTFTVGPADHTSPDPERWRLEPPTSPDDPLVVELNEPADVALLQRLPTVHDATGTPVPGTVDVASDGRRFEFVPAKQWESGSYELLVPATLEDPSGNRVDRLFEEAERSESVASAEQVVLPFQVTHP